MKHWTYILILTIISCNNQQPKTTSPDTSALTPPVTTANKETEGKNEICWIATLGGKTPILIHYQLVGNLVIGEITYLNTKDKFPIKLLGTIEENNSYRL